KVSNSTDRRQNGPARMRIARRKGDFPGQSGDFRLLVAFTREQAVKAPQLAVAKAGITSEANRRSERMLCSRDKVPPSERTDHVVAATLRCDALHLSAHPVR